MSLCTYPAACIACNADSRRTIAPRARLSSTGPAIQPVLQWPTTPSSPNTHHDFVPSRRALRPAGTPTQAARDALQELRALGLLSQLPSNRPCGYAAIILITAVCCTALSACTSPSRLASASRSLGTAFTTCSSPVYRWRAIYTCLAGTGARTRGPRATTLLP